MLTAKEQLAHIVAGMTEDEAERLLEMIGANADDDIGKTRRAAEMLKAAARLLYEVGSPECVQVGERVDAVLNDLISLIAKNEFRKSLTESLRSFAQTIIGLIQRDKKTP